MIFPFILCMYILYLYIIPYMYMLLDNLSEWVIGVLSCSWTILQSYRDWNKVYQAQWLGLHVWTKSCLLVVCMCWTRLALVRTAVSLYSASPLKHHVTGRQWCPNPDQYPDSKPASRSLTPWCWALSRAAEPQILTSFVWRSQGSNHQPPAWGERSTTTLPGHGLYNLKKLDSRLLCNAMGHPGWPRKYPL